MVDTWVLVLLLRRAAKNLIAIEAIRSMLLDAGKSKWKSRPNKGTPMKHSILCIVASLAFLGAAQRAMAGPIFVNGSFEADPWSGYVSNPTVTGWTVTGPGDGYPYGVHNGPGGPTPFGTQFIVPGGFGSGGGTAEQTVSGFTSGLGYEVTFDLSSESTGSGALARLSIL